MNEKFLRKLIFEQIEAGGMKRGEVALRAGMSREMLYKFESGKSDIGLVKAIQLLRAVGLRMEVRPDIEPLPKDFRSQKDREQRAYLARRRPEAAVGVALGAKVEVVSVPHLGDELA